jgi:hypothetical protein
VVGGSLGSKSLYEGLVAVLEENPEREKDFIFIVIGGFINTDI